MVTIFDIMNDQKIIKKYKLNNHTFFTCLENKEYIQVPYIDSKKSMSKNESLFAEYLKKKCYSFRQQVKVPGCKYINDLPFDFLVIIDDIEIYVEIDGKQHYVWIPYFHKLEEDFQLQQKRDRIKDKFY